MNFKFTDEQERLRQEVRDFIKANPVEKFPCQIKDEGYGFGGWSYEFSRQLGKKGWLSIAWPKEYGGLGMSLMDMFIVKDELAYFRAPTMANFFNDSVGLSILAHGSEEQKREFLPKMSRGEIFFCTGLSEPNSGSDLLSLETRANLEGDYFIINGQKLWTSGAFLSDWLLVVVKTDLQAPRHKGISTILVDLKTPGITVRPVADMTGSKSFSEVFFDEVKVPKSNLLGELNRGFQQVIETLEGDRFWGRCVRASASRKALEEMVCYCQEIKDNGTVLAKDPVIRDKLAEIAIEIEICRLLSYRCIVLLDKGVTLTHEASILKTFADELGQRASNLWMQILGMAERLDENERWGPLRTQMTHEYLFSPALTIAGGTSEIQRNTIAIRGLGLPRGQ